MKNIFLQIATLTFLAIFSKAFGQASPGAIFKGDSIYMLKSNQLFKDSNLKFFTGDSDSPTSVATDAASGSLYFEADSGTIYRKLDNGSTTNWSPMIGGASGLGTDNCVVRWDGTAIPLLQDSIFCISDLGVGSGLTALIVDNFNVDGNTIAATGDMILQPTGNVNFPGLTASRAVILDASKNITTSTTTSTEISYVNGVTSSIQTQLNGKLGTGLGDGKIWIGDATGTAQEQTATGDVFINNAGVTSIATGSIVNGDISASAAIESSKIALPNANSVAYGNSSSALTNESTFTYNDSTDVLSLTGQANFDNIRLDGNTLSTTSGNLTVSPTVDFNVTTAADFDSSVNMDSTLTLDSDFILTSSTATVRHLDGNRSISINGGNALGTANGAQIQLFGSGHASTPDDLVLNAGSGSGDISFKRGAGTYGSMDLNGKWVIGSGGGTETHIIHGNINGSGSGAFTGAIEVGTNINVLAQGDLRLQDSSGGEYVAIQASGSVVSSYTISMPTSQGSSGNTMINDGSGNLRWDFATTEPTYLSTTVATNSTIADNDGYSVIYVNDSNPTVTITLPTAADNTNRRITVKNISTDQGTVTLDGEGSETIDGYTSLTLDFKQAYVTVQSNGTEWKIVSTNLNTYQKKYSLTVTGTNWTTATAIGIPFKDMDGNWYIYLNITGTLSVAASNPVLTVTGITTANVANMYQVCTGSGTAVDFYWCYFGVNTNTIDIAYAATHTRALVQAIVKLESKPTFVE